MNSTPLLICFFKHYVFNIWSLGFIAILVSLLVISGFKEYRKNNKKTKIPNVTKNYSLIVFGCLLVFAIFCMILTFIGVLD